MIRLATLVLILSIGTGPAWAQVQPEAFSYPVGLNPAGDNWVALRSLPSGTAGVRLARIGPETLFTELGRSGGWVQVRLTDGQTGWVSAQHVGCCRTVAVTPPKPSMPLPDSCEDLWYQRNAVYKLAGYCFRTARAVTAFGNDSCRYDNETSLPLSEAQREVLAEVRDKELRLRCAP